ncbi:MAG: ABC transporter substrate-binding protein [Haloarculaceae archaeon]
MTDTAQVMMPQVPAQSNANLFASQSAIANMGSTWMTELIMPYLAGTTDFQTSGKTWDVGPIGDGEHEVATWVKDYRIEPPFDWWETYDDRMAFWDGTPMNTDVVYLADEIGYYGEGLGKFSAGSKNYEKVSEWEYHEWREKGEEKELSPSPANRFNIERNNVGPYDVPNHPDFTRSWAKKLRNAGSKDEANKIYKNLQSKTISYFDWAEKGWGSGLYKIPSGDDISNSEVHMEARDDHPNKSEQTIPNLNIKVAADATRQNTLTNQGVIDVQQGLISPSSGQVNRKSLPNYIQQLSQFPSGAMFGYPINWKRGDLGNLWVRRALMAVLDFDQIGTNATFPNGYILADHWTGTSNSIAETWLSQDFLDKLHDWPVKSDPELAAKYMRKGGYTKQGGRWVRPNGKKAQLLGKTSAGYGQSYVVAMQTAKGVLDSFGLPVKLENMSTSAFNTSRDNMTYDFVYMWNNQRSPFEAYTAGSGWWAAKLVERDPDFPNSFDGWSDGRWPDLEPVENAEGEVQPPDKYDLRGQPLNQQLPTEVGNISAPKQAGRQPDLQAAGVDAKDINLMKMVLDFNRNPQLTQDQFKSLLKDFAWYYNYYIPDIWPFTYADGLMGNVRDYRWAPGGSNALKTNVKLGANFAKYQSQAGLIFKKYNKDFEKP